MTYRDSGAKAAQGIVLLCAAFAFTTSNARAAGPAASRDVVEVVPTARQEPATWRYTFERPADGWNAAAFDDSAWQSGRGGFGVENTPGIVLNTHWTTGELWSRRQITLPAATFDPATLQLLVFYDEDVEIFLDGVLAARRDGYVTDYQPIEISSEARARLKPGATIVLAAHCRNRGGGQGFDAGLARVSASWLAARRRDRYRDFAMRNPGDAARGKRLFEDDQRLACARCHSTDGSASRAAPDLKTVGDKFPRRELIEAVLEPSRQIAVGYETTIVTTTSGDAIVGVLKESADEHLALMNADGRLTRIASTDIRARRTQPNASIMPEGLETGLSREEFADLVEYLATLRLPELADANRAGMPRTIPELRPAVGLVPIHGPDHRFDKPDWAGEVPGEPGVFLVCEHQSGRIWRLAVGTSDAPTTKTLFADLRREIRPGGASGLLGLAFHPRFRENRKYYVQHTLEVDRRIVARVSERRADVDFSRDSGNSSRTIIEFRGSTWDHVGGGIAFGPDGFMYIGMGDTGPQTDPQGHGQDPRSLLGKMLRIDVDGAESSNAYAIPRDNPFASATGGSPNVDVASPSPPPPPRKREGGERPTPSPTYSGERAGERGKVRETPSTARISTEFPRPEIFALGFREPWRFSFDALTGELWVGDVGQDRIEEVGIVCAGENHGWNVYEGFDLFSIRHRREGAKFVPPVFAYNRRLGNSITGGFVYRGDPQSAFYGVYVCADFTSRRVWGLKQSGRKLTDAWQIATSPEPVASFAQGVGGELYLVGYDGTIFRVDFSTAKLPRGSL